MNENLIDKIKEFANSQNQEFIVQAGQGISVTKSKNSYIVSLNTSSNQNTKMINPVLVTINVCVDNVPHYLDVWANGTPYVIS
jgi:hypothetical protein